MDFGGSCLGACAPMQVLNITMPINDMALIKVYDDCDCEYDLTKLEFAYSLDSLCWSCYMSYTDAMKNTIELAQDFYIRLKIAGPITKVLYDDADADYSTNLAECFNFSTTLTGTYNPYANLDNAIALNQQLAESVSQMTGIPCYYIKLKPEEGAKDIVFKEYTLLNVDTIKQVKIIIRDNEMPSSKPEFNDFGIDWQTDWEVELTKSSFATAFGNTAHPMEGDLVYIPMMKRMWMVNDAYEEKKEGFMWVNTTFKLMLVKYQEKASVDLGDAQSFVDSVVKNKYEDLFGEDNFGTLASNEQSLDAPKYPQNKLYNVFESDAVRKYVTCDTIDMVDNKLYYKGVMIADRLYTFLLQDPESVISYQYKHCGDTVSMSFIIKANTSETDESDIISIGNIKLHITQQTGLSKLWLNTMPDVSIEIPSDTETFVVIRWSKALNIYEMHAYRYTFPVGMPQYKLQPIHYYFDIDNPVSEVVSKYDIELEMFDKAEVALHNLNGYITNFKLFDIYIEDINDLLLMYPNHQHLRINDTCRKLVNGIGARSY